jgi:Uma2 family endonuclease
VGHSCEGPSVAVDRTQAGNFLLAWQGNVNDPSTYPVWSGFARGFNSSLATVKNDFRVDLAGRSPPATRGPYSDWFALAWADNRGLVTPTQARRSRPRRDGRSGLRLVSPAKLPRVRDPWYGSAVTRSALSVRRPRLMTLEEWADLDEDAEGELVDGVLEEEEMPSLLHELVVAWLIGILRVWVRRRKGFVTGSETKIAVGARRGRKPDVALFLHGALPPVDAALIRTPPHLVVEVASPRPRDMRRDRIDKLADYARTGIRYYWIVDPQLRVVEIFELAPNGRYQVALNVGHGRLAVPGCAGLVLDVDALWDELDEAMSEDPGSRRGRNARKRTAVVKTTPKRP